MTDVQAEEVFRDVVGAVSNKYVVLNSDISFAKQVTASNTYYVIRNDFDLKGKTVRIPSGCELKFEGGSIDNGTIECNNTVINGSYNCFRPSLTIKGGHSSIDLSWLGVIGSNPNNSTILNSLNRISGSSYESGRSFYLTDDVVCTEGDIVLPWDVTIDGRNHSIAFSCDKTKNALLCLSQNTNLQNIKIRATSTL